MRSRHIATNWELILSILLSASLSRRAGEGMIEDCYKFPVVQVFMATIRLFLGSRTIEI